MANIDCCHGLRKQTRTSKQQVNIYSCILFISKSQTDSQYLLRNLIMDEYLVLYCSHCTQHHVLVKNGLIRSKGHYCRKCKLTRYFCSECYDSDHECETTSAEQAKIYREIIPFFWKNRYNLGLISDDIYGVIENWDQFKVNYTYSKINPENYKHRHILGSNLLATFKIKQLYIIIQLYINPTRVVPKESNAISIPLEQLSINDNIPYARMSDGEGIIGDFIYEPTSICWWNYSISEKSRRIPTNLGEVLTAITQYNIALEMCKKYKINLIVCECAGYLNSPPMMKFYKFNGTDDHLIEQLAEESLLYRELSDSDEDPLYITDIRDINSSYHIIYIDYCDTDILQSTVRIYNGYHNHYFGLKKERDYNKEYTLRY